MVGLRALAIQSATASHAPPTTFRPELSGAHWRPVDQRVGRGYWRFGGKGFEPILCLRGCSSLFGGSVGAFVTASANSTAEFPKTLKPHPPTQPSTLPNRLVRFTHESLALIRGTRPRTLRATAGAVAVDARARDRSRASPEISDFWLANENLRFSSTRGEDEGQDHRGAVRGCAVLSGTSAPRYCSRSRTRRCSPPRKRDQIQKRRYLARIRRT